MASDFDQKINSIADSMNKFRKESKTYSIVSDKNEDFATTDIWRMRDGLGYGHGLKCKISINPGIMDYYKLSDDSLAWIIGHELAHCELKHNKHISLIRIARDLWKEEYDADILGKELMTQAGYNFKVVFSEMLIKDILDSEGSTTHPDRDSRLANMSTPNQIRVYPDLIKRK